MIFIVQNVHINLPQVKGLGKQGMVFSKVSRDYRMAPKVIISGHRDRYNNVTNGR